MDSTLRCWDVRPFVGNSAAVLDGQGQSTRCERVIYGNHHGAEKLLLRCAWSPDQERICCGSADRYKDITDFTVTITI